MVIAKNHINFHTKFHDHRSKDVVEHQLYLEIFDPKMTNFFHMGQVPGQKWFMAILNDLY